MAVSDCGSSSGGRPVSGSLMMVAIPVPTSARSSGGSSAAPLGSSTMGPPWSACRSSIASMEKPPPVYTVKTARGAFCATLSAGLRVVMPATPVNTFVICEMLPSATDSR